MTIRLSVFQTGRSIGHILYNSLIINIVCGAVGSSLPNPIKPSRSRSNKQKESAQGAVAVSIELRPPTGTMMRISGNLTGRELKNIIMASSIHV